MAASASSNLLTDENDLIGLYFCVLLLVKQRIFFDGSDLLLVIFYWTYLNAGRASRYYGCYVVHAAV